MDRCLAPSNLLVFSMVSIYSADNFMFKVNNIKTPKSVKHVPLYLSCRSSVFIVNFELIS